MQRVSSVDLFDRLADRYGDGVPFFETFGRRLVALIDPPPGSALLDVGAGLGAVAIPAAERGCRVTAVDAAPRMVERLRTLHPGVDARVMNAAALDLAGASFDVAVAAFAIHCMNDPELVVGELCRVVRPGGVVVLTVPGDFDDGGRWAAFHGIPAGLRPRPGIPPVARPTDPGALLRQAGLVELEATSIEIHLPVSSPEVMWEFQMSHGYAGYVESFAAEDQAELKRRGLRVLRAMHESGGIDLHRAAAVHIGRVALP